MDINKTISLDETQITAIVAAFYQGVRRDDLIGPMYPDNDWDGAEQRLRDFLVYRFGGSDRYIQERGHPRLRMRHAPFSIGDAERDRWLQLMGGAIETADIPVEARPPLIAFFKQVADFLKNQ